MTRVCIDGFNIGMAKGTGIATYGRNLLRNLNDAGLDTQILYGPLASINRKRPILNEIALVDAHTPRDRPVQRKIETLTARLGRTATGIVPSETVIWPARGGGRPAASAYWSSPRLFATANRAFAADGVFTPLRFRPHGTVPRPDVMHWTTALPCQAKGLPNVYTIHDLIPLRLPHTTLDNKRIFLGLCRQIARRADHIAVVSEATKRDVMDILGVAEDRITVTWQSIGIPPRLMAKPDDSVAAELASVHQLEWKGYYLYFGAIEPKKNLARIVEAYLASGSTRPLVVVGGRAWLDEDETALMNQIRRTKKGREKRIRLYDFLPFSLLVDLIRGARGTLFPSLYEGFGLPVLESMALGTPVVTSTAASLPEVAGEAALMADPYDTAAISACIRTLDADDDLAADLSVRGRIQAQTFSPEAYQARLTALYARVA